jgi:Holliday junction resolvasome RuvABC DNA-binding subunit
MVLTEKDWEQFDHDYNEASNNFMARKHKQHPRLTTRDLRYIALYSLGFDNIDICLLFDIGKAAGWNIKTNLLYRLSEKDLEVLRSGYRAEYILNTARAVCDGTLDFTELKKIPYKEAKKKLLSVRGIGEKVANCILLFGLGQIEAFPVDTWMKRH